VSADQATLRADRVRKARTDSACGLCGSPVTIGTLIGRIPAGDGRHCWAHLDCIRAVRQDRELAQAR
jgi:hypothetical protein